MSMSLLSVASHGVFGGGAGGTDTQLDPQDVRAGTIYSFADIQYTGTLTPATFYELGTPSAFTGSVADFSSPILTIIDLNSTIL